MALSKGKNPKLPNKSATKTCTTLPTFCVHSHCFSSVSPACTYTHRHLQNSRKNRCTTLWRAMNSDSETNFAKCYKTIKMVTIKWLLKIAYPAVRDTVLSEESCFPRSGVGCQSTLIVPNPCFPTVESCSSSPAEDWQQCHQHFHRNRVKCHSLPQQKQVNKVQHFLLRSNQVYLFSSDQRCLSKFPDLWMATKQITQIYQS